MQFSQKISEAAGASNRPALAHANDEIAQQLSFLGLLPREQRQCLPDWMVIAPPKTGTTWVSENFRRHPQMFVPLSKEVKYFSNRFATEDLRWYLGQFREGLGKSKGEAPPSYSLLPRSTIRIVRQLMPDLKLVFLMRDPIARAWSHARHCFRFREANFKGRLGAIDTVSDAEWIENLADDWNRLCGDYLGQLQRWLSVFPREQLFLAFFDDIVDSPRATLHQLFKFLGVDEGFADSSDVALEAANVGLTHQMPARVAAHLTRLYGPRTRELAEFLAREFDLQVPNSWHAVLDDQAQSSGECHAVIDWQVDDARLRAVLARDDLTHLDFLGFQVIERGSGFMAYRTSLGPLSPDDYSQHWWDDQAAAGNCVFARNIYDLKNAILQAIVSRTIPPGSEPYRLHRAELQLDNLERRCGDLASVCGELSRLVQTCLDSINQQKDAQTRSGRSVLPLPANVCTAAPSEKVPERDAA
ncbi:MAG: sulfotransferase domain-containing protein [Planctomycetia bacterium]|nr:sulfotransferase domain-containing protein [Planctomycetia bacterium]